MARITFEDKNKFAGQPFNELKATEVNEIKNSVNALYDGEGGYAVVEELPDTIPVGTQLLYNGTMWRGLLEGESSLTAGTPIPTRGYWDVVFRLSFNLDTEEIISQSLIRDEYSMNSVTVMEGPPFDITIESPNDWIDLIFEINVTSISSDEINCFISGFLYLLLDSKKLVVTADYGGSEFDGITTLTAGIKIYPPPAE